MEKFKILIVLLSLSFISAENDFTSTPVVLWHGMGLYNCFESEISQDFSETLSLFTISF